APPPHPHSFPTRRSSDLVCALLAAGLLAGGCHDSRRPGPQPRPKPLPKLSFRALDAEQQRLVRDYQPVSRALTAYEEAYREWRRSEEHTSELQSRRDLVC